MRRSIIATMSALGIFLGIAAISEMKQAQDQATQPKLGVLQFTKHPALDAINQGMLDELKAAGYTPGKNLTVDFQNAQGDQSNLKTMATRFANENVTATVGIATPAAVTLANTVNQTPSVFSGVTNPVGAKLVKDEAHPEGLITGTSDRAPLADQLKLIKAFVPELQTLGILYTSSDDSASTEAKRMAQLAEKAGVPVKMLSITSTNDLNQTAQQLVADPKVGAVFVPTDNTIASAMPTLIQTTNAKRIPVFPTVDTMVAAGGVAAESVNQYQLGKLTGQQVVAVLKGAPIKQIPVKTVARGELVINRKQAKQLGIQIPAAYAHGKTV